MLRRFNWWLLNRSLLSRVGTLSVRVELLPVFWRLEGRISRTQLTMTLGPVSATYWHPDRSCGTWEYNPKLRGWYWSAMKAPAPPPTDSQQY